MELSHIYIITDGTDFKVGVSKNPDKRLKQLQTGSSEKLSIVKIFEVPDNKVYSLEKEAHTLIQYKYPKRGEWFKNAVKGDIERIIDMVCQEYL